VLGITSTSMALQYKKWQLSVSNGIIIISDSRPCTALQSSHLSTTKQAASRQHNCCRPIRLNAAHLFNHSAQEHGMPTSSTRTVSFGPWSFSAAADLSSWNSLPLEVKKMLPTVGEFSSQLKTWHQCSHCRFQTSDCVKQKYCFLHNGGGMVHMPTSQLQPWLHVSNEIKRLDSTHSTAHSKSNNSINAFLHF